MAPPSGTLTETASETVEPPEPVMSKTPAVVIPIKQTSKTPTEPSIESLSAPSLEAHDSTSGDYEDETGSETHEAVTPTSDIHPASFHHQNGTTLENTPAGIAVVGNPKTPLPLISEPASLPASMDGPVVQHSTPLDLKSRPKPVTRQSTTSKIQKFFHRKPQDTVEEQPQLPPQPARSGSDEALSTVSRFRRFSGAKSAHVSPVGSMSNSPPLSNSPNATISQPISQWPSASSTSPPSSTRAKRSTTGLKENVGRIVFSTKDVRPSTKRRNSMTGAPFFKPDNSISIPAAAGVGLKARRMSTSLPDDFDVDTVELNTEYTSTSVIPGRRGKTLGKGATASVKLMAKKGGPADCVYAVKEFRKKGQEEDKTEYEQKVKSEYSIAKSLHHPNIVESFRLCTHSGRWNHVMEYCPLEVYSLVEKKYMSEVDKNCLFKQLLRGVVYLHDHGIAHRDIKLENLLLTLDGQLKITDFGVSEVFCGEHPGVRASGGECGKNMKEVRRSAPGICGSLPYIAPEVIEKNGKYDPRPLDVWSCAIVAMTLHYNGSIWPKAAPTNPTYKAFQRGWDVWLSKHPENPVPQTSDDLPKCGAPFGLLPSYAEKRTILRMLHPDPVHRISIREALEENWVKNLECCVIENYDQMHGKVDVTQKGSCRLAAKAVRKMHNHLPPTSRVPTMSFNIRDG